MIKAEDLRFGNYFNYYDGKFTGSIVGIKGGLFSSSLSVFISAKGGGYTETDIKDLTPIQLKLSMLDVSAENTVEYTITNGRKSIIVRINDDERKDIFVFFKDDVGMLYCEVAFNPYVHELQNICHALIGAEPVFKF